MSDERLRRRQDIAFAVALTLFGLVALWVLFLVRHVLLLLYVAGLLAIGFGPAVRWLEQRRGAATAGRRRRRLPRWAAILILYVFILGTLGGLLAVILPPLVSQSTDLWQKLPTYADELQGVLQRRGLISHPYTWNEMLKNVPSPGLAVAGVFGALQSVAGAVGAFVTILVLPYYLLLDAQSLESGFLRIFPHSQRREVATLTHEVTLKISAWLGGQLVLAFIIGSTAALGLWLLGVPYFYVLALVAGVGELIPVVGPILAAIPAILVAFTVSVETGIFTASYFVIQQFVENHFLVPRVMQRQVGVSAVTVIAALLIGSELLGIVGALLAVPTAAILQVLFDAFVARGKTEAA
ncbi:MAG TPA: AI-2E family transporter [Vicinamibacterales bacterium]|nr:AI-2E family transporter [Vicinamibacterales bacterium]